MTEKLYTVKRIPDGKFVDLRVQADGGLQLTWVCEAREAAGMPRYRAHMVAGLMALAAGPRGDDIVIEEEQP